jgi:ABC-type transport system involved in multi-copper enzyme maturation permease subunit
MFPGPVFSAELLTTARRPRYYAVRFLYGAILLFVVWRNDPALYSWYYSSSGGELSIQALALLGRTLFSSFLVVQSVAILLVTPALVAGVIAEEKQRKTLHYLLASPLSSAEIILGKLAARMVHVGVFLAIGVPVMSLLSLFGGVDPRLVLVAFAASVTTAFFISALAILISTHARRVREAMALTYLLTVFWLVMPPIIGMALPGGGVFWTRVYEWLKPVNDWIAPTSPLFVLLSSGLSPIRGSTLPALIQWMIGLQVAYGLLFVLLAVLRLRPVGRKEGGGAGAQWAAAMRRGRRLLPRPACGDDAMLWKERYVSRTSVTTKIASAIVLSVVVCGLVYMTYDWARPAFREVLDHGYGTTGVRGARGEFNSYLRFICTFIYVLWALGVASAASSGLTSEREEDTWTSLVTTPLEGVEIIRAKMIGAVWGLRWVGAVLAALWLTGLAAGAIHPFGLAAVVLETTAFLWFATALGTYSSLRARNSGRSLLTTLAVLFVVNGAYLLCCIPVRTSSWLMSMGVTPVIEAVSLVSYEDVRAYFAGERFGPRVDQTEVILTGIMGLLAYTAAAAFLTHRAISRFDRVVDRPFRPGATTLTDVILLDDAVEPDDDLSAVDKPKPA